MKRQLPFLKSISLLINGSYGLIAISLIIFSSLFVLSTINDIDFGEIKYLREDVSVGSGVISNIFETGTIVNDEAVYGYDYIFLSPIGNLEWTSFHLGYIYEIGDTVEIEYSSIRPDVNRIKGMNNTPGGLFLLLFTIPFLIGFVWITINIVKGVKKYRLLKIGIYTSTKFIRKESTKIEINDRSVYKYFYSFLDKNGVEHLLSLNTSTPEKLDSDEGVIAVFDPYNPNNAMLVDSLPTGISDFIKENWR